MSSVSTIISFEGTMGTGKSTATTATAIENQKRTGKKIVSNNHIYVPNWEQFSLEWLKMHIQGDTIEDMIIIWDETNIIDSRDHSTNTNKFLTQFITQLRKRNSDLYICVHYIGNIDIRLQRAIDVRGACNTFKRVCPRCRCKTCHGTGFIGDTVCTECNGVGGTGKDGANKCEMCLGYGIVAETTMSFLNRRIKSIPLSWPWCSPKMVNMPMPRRLRPIGIFANAYWPFFDTTERVPMIKKLLDRIDTAEVAL